MDENLNVLAQNIFDTASEMIKGLKPQKINHKLFPPCMYQEKIQVAEGKPKVVVNHFDVSLRNMEERGHVYKYDETGKPIFAINRNLPILNSVKLIGELTQNENMINLYNICAQNCEQIVVSQIGNYLPGLIKDGKINFEDGQIYTGEIWRCWRDCHKEEQETTELIDDETAKLCEAIKDDYAKGFEVLKNDSFVCEDEKVARQIEKLVAPQDIEQKSLGCGIIPTEALDGAKEDGENPPEA